MTGRTAGVDPTRLEPYITVALEKLASRPSVLIALDFDGCLSPLVDDPDSARPIPEAAAALEELSTDADLDLAVVSGRPANDLIHLASPPAGTWVIGSHGAEFGRVGPDGELNREEFSLGPVAAALLVDVTDGLEAIAAQFPGAWVEHKPAAAVLHTRRMERDVAPEARAAALAGPGRLAGVHPMEGNEVVELAVVEATKGAALTSLRRDVEERRGQAVTVLYAGDDVTDETALATLEFSDVGIKVGDGATVARFRVIDPPAMAAALRLLVHHRRQHARG